MTKAAQDLAVAADAASKQEADRLRADVEDEIRRRQEQYRRAFEEALEAGWQPQTLAPLGLRPPTAAVRSKKKQATRPGPAAGASTATTVVSPVPGAVRHPGASPAPPPAS